MYREPSNDQPGVVDRRPDGNKLPEDRLWLAGDFVNLASSPGGVRDPANGRRRHGGRVPDQDLEAPLVLDIRY